MGAGDQDSGLRLAELVAAFSLATDLGMGQPMEHVLRSWLIAVRLGERLGLDAEARVALYYVMALAWVGCVADTAEVAAWFGDDIAFREAVRLATDGNATGVACDGCPPRAGLVKRYEAAGGRYYLCPICFNAKKLSPESLIGGAELQGTAPMWLWIGDEPATTFSY